MLMKNLVSIEIGLKTHLEPPLLLMVKATMKKIAQLVKILSMLDSTGVEQYITSGILTMAC